MSRTTSAHTNEVALFGEGLERVAVRPITPDIYWITHCVGDLAQEYYADYFSTLPNADEFSGSRIVDYPFSAFLIDGEQPLLIDTVAPKQKEAMLEALKHILGDRKLAYIWISHIELPHAGNAAAIIREHPDAKIVTMAGGDHYELHNLGEALMVNVGDTIDLGKYKVEMVDPLFVDHGLSQWLYEHTTGFFFPADWGHNLHEPACNECFMFLDEMLAGTYTEDLFVSDVKVNAWYQFPWLKWTDPDEIGAAVDDLFAKYDIKIFAASHGSIIRKDADQFFDLIKQGMMQASSLAK